MKKQPVEPDFIGSPEPLTVAEAAALAAYFAAKKAEAHKPIRRLATQVANHQKITT